MLRQVLILCFCLLVLSVDYCEVNEDQSNVFITKDQIRRLNLNSFIKGFDLSFDADSPQAKIYSSYEVSVNRNLNLKDYASLKSVDMRQFDSMVGGQLTLLAQKDNNMDIALWVGDFVGYESLPDLSAFRVFTLPSGQKANCFDARAVSTEGDVILNCQSIPQSDSEDPFDILCHIDSNDTELNFGVNCNQISSLGISLSRKSRVLNIQERTYLLSQNSDLDQSDNTTTIDYILVYYLNRKGEFVFANVIDGSQLDKPTLKISDFVITKDNEIIVADQASSRLIYYSYYVYNDVKVDREIALNSPPLAIAYRARHDTIIVGTQAVITEHDVEDPNLIVGKYQLDPKDNKITEIQVSTSLLAFRTTKNNLFLYQRNEHKINYLLDRVSFPSSNSLILSPHIAFLYTFNLTNAQAVSVSDPYLSLYNVSEDQTIKITGKSTKKQCQAQVSVKYVEDINDIIDKKNVTSLKIDPTTGLALDLKNYYGGANLIFNASEKTKNPDFQVKVNQIQSLDVKASFGTAEKTSILQIDRDSFYLVGINSIKENMVYVDYCSKKSGDLNCQHFWNERNPLIQCEGIPVDLIEGKIRANGDPIIAWTYSYTHVFAYVNLRKGGIGSTIRGSVEGLPISSIKLSETYSIFVSKAERYIEIFWQEKSVSTVLEESSFTAEQLQSLQQFYPREVVLHPLGTGSFFVKFPTRIARFVILDDYSVKFAGIVRDFEQYILDAEWTFTYTGTNVVTIRNKQLKEEFYNPSTEEYETLQSIPFQNPNFSGLNYDTTSGLVTVNIKDTSNANQQTLKAMIPDAGSLDSQYVQMKLTGASKVSQNWVLVSSNPPKVHHINSFPELSIQTHIPDDQSKEDIEITIDIKSASKNETSKTTIEGLNFPVTIKDHPNSDVIKLPANASNLEIQLDVDSFFTGPVADYSIHCPFCSSSKIKLETSIYQQKVFKELTEVVDYATVENRILALSNSQLFLLDSQTLEVVKSEDIPVGNCKNMAYDSLLGLFLFCTSSQSPTGQLLLQYTIKNDRIDLYNAMIVPEDNLIMHFDEMFIYYSTPTSYLMILDNDQRIDSNKKDSTIKVFSLEGDKFAFAEEWDSRDFGTELLYPINDLDVLSNILLVTLGNYGMGYATFNQGKLISPNYIQLSAIAQIKDIMLPTSFFKQIEMLKYNQQVDEISVFITITNSLSFVANFIVDAPHFIFKSISETYNRYGRERLLNWHYVTDQHIFLSYYNETTELVTIVYYIRMPSLQNQFEEGVTVKLASNLVQYHQAYVVADKLLVSHLTNMPTTGSLIAYTLKNGYYLLLNYEEPGDFSQISVQASNTYHQIMHSQKIEFDSAPPPPPPPPPPPGPDDGLKWYVVVIVCAVVLLIVGVSYGLFLHMKKKRLTKNVSLLTEKEDIDADSDQIPGKDNPLEQRLNKTTTLEQ